MQYTALTITCVFTSQAIFPLYQGSMLRGGLGNSLRRAVCIKQQKECPACMLRRTCVFPKLFASAGAAQNTHAAPVLPPPFCLEPGQSDKSQYEEGDSFSFTLKLFSYGCDYLPYFIHAFTLAGQKGLGKEIHEGRGRFRIVDVRNRTTSLYDPQTEHLDEAPTDTLSIPTVQDAAPSPQKRLTVNLQTPLRFKQQSRLADALPFSALVGLVHRRISSLWALEGEDFRLTEDRFHSVMAAASAIKTHADDLHWYDWKRYSGRQNTTMQLGGLVGSIFYEGALDDFAEYLAFAEIAHLGKQTSFGLGRIAVQDGWVL